MYNYHPDIIWKIDAVLLALSLFIVILILLSEAISRNVWNKRSKALLNIKEHVYEMVLAGKTFDKKEFTKLLSTISPQQFIDITTNRNRELIFFNSAEQELFKKYFISDKNILRLKKLAEKGRDKWLRIEAIMSLGYAGVSDSINIMKKALLGKDEDLSYFSMVALGQIKTIESAKALLEFVKINKDIRYKLISILENFPVIVSDEAVKLTHDSDPSVRSWAVLMLSKFKKEQHINRIKELADDESSEVRASVCEYLGRSGKRDAAGVLEKLLKDDVWTVREAAVLALSELIGKESVPILVPLMGDGSISVIASVKNVFADHIEESLPYITKLLESSDEMAKKMALEALEESGYMSKLLNMILKGADSEVKKAIELLRGIIRSGGYVVIEWSLRTFSDKIQSEILQKIQILDPDLAANVAKNKKIGFIE